LNVVVTLQLSPKCCLYRIYDTFRVALTCRSKNTYVSLNKTSWVVSMTPEPACVHKLYLFTDLWALGWWRLTARWRRFWSHPRAHVSLSVVLHPATFVFQTCRLVHPPRLSTVTMFPPHDCASRLHDHGAGYDATTTPICLFLLNALAWEKFSNCFKGRGNSALVLLR